MASTAPNTILLTVNGAERPIYEYKADEALTPGELVCFDADDELEPHGTAGGLAQKIFVVENPYAPDNTQKAIDQDYALGDYARVIYAQSGDGIYAWLKAGEEVAKGAPLVSDGAGGLQEPAAVDATLISGAIVAFADEDKDNSGGGARVRIKVRVA